MSCVGWIVLSEAFYGMLAGKAWDVSMATWKKGRVVASEERSIKKTRFNIV
jgi:hypothetical protein